MNNDKNMIIRVLIVILMMIGAIAFFNVSQNKKENEDAIKFKEEYEKLNNEKVGEFTYSKIDIKEDNPFVYADAKDVVNTLKNGTGLIYIGFSSCPWCRNAVNVLQHVNMDKIMYLDIKDLRDTYEVVDGNLKKTKEGTKEYYELLDILKDILPDYEIEKDGVTYNANERRIYVPLVIGVKKGKIVGYQLDTVTLNEGQTAFDALTEKQQSDLKIIYDEITSKVKINVCMPEEGHGC